MRWAATDLSGAVLDEGRLKVVAKPRSDTLAGKLNLKSLLAEHGKDRVLVWLELVSGRMTIADNLVMFARPKRMELIDPKLVCDIHEIDDGFRVSVAASGVALWTWLEVKGSAARFTDNFVHVAPGRPATIDVYPDLDLSMVTFRRRLCARSLMDTYS